MGGFSGYKNLCYNHGVLCEDLPCFPGTGDESDDDDFKCSLCEGYFPEDDDYIELGRNTGEECEGCGQGGNRMLVQMKTNGQIMCQRACDESSEDESSDSD